MADLDDLRRKYALVVDFRYFDPNDRIWWIYLRNAAIEIASREDLPEMRVACNLLRDFPENVPDERANWLALREAVAAVIKTL